MKSSGFAAAVFAGVLFASCSSEGSHHLGASAAGSPRSIAQARTVPASTPVTVRGAMYEKCPVAGCWFNVRDSTGVIRVDTKSAAFVVVDVPINTTVTVTGKLARNGQDPVIEASGVRY